MVVDAQREPGQLLFAGFDGLAVPDDLAALVGAGRVGGVILFARNVESPQQLRALVESLHARAPESTPLTVAIDQEGGRVQRCRAPWTEWPPMRRLGERDRLEDTRAVARALARELADLRIDLDFAPCVDLDGGPAGSVIGDRSFAAAAATVARHAAAFVEAMQSTGVAACAKHFPGHGGTRVDSHERLPRLERSREELLADELVPFDAAVRAGVASVMTAHLLVPDLDPERPSTLAPAALRLLREDLGFDGLVFGDDLEMKAIADHFTPAQITRGALEAGVDGLLVCRDAVLRDAVLAELEGLPAELVAPGLRRMAAFKRQWSGGRHARGGGPPYAEHETLAQRLRASDAVA